MLSKFKGLNFPKYYQRLSGIRYLSITLQFAFYDPLKLPIMQATPFEIR
jgi:hypothetical protein